MPSSPRQVVLGEAAPLLVEVPGLATVETFASIEVFDPGDRPHETLDLGGQPLRSWRLAVGRATVTNLPAGQWILRILTPDGQRWQAAVTTDGRTGQRVVIE